MAPSVISPTITSPKPAIMGKNASRFTGSASNSREATPTAGKPATTAKGDSELSSIFKCDLTSIRNLVTCSICDQLLYEPWTLGCGHTYCYSCLCNWFVPNRRKKTCPECRTVVKEIPAPAFLVKQMVEILCKRSELMPSDESIDQHNTKRAEEMADVERDKNSPDGLFKGTFPPRRAELLYDEADGVFRCPCCQHEHEGGPICAQCGTLFEDGYGFSDIDEDADLEDLEDLEFDLDAELADGHHHHHHHHNHFLSIPHFGLPSHVHFHHHHDDESEISNSDSSDMDEDSEEDDEGSLQEFVVPDDEPVNREPNNDQNNRQPITISDDESDEGGAISNRRRRHRGWAEQSLSPTTPSVLTVTDSANGSEHGDSNTEADMLRNAGWSPLDTENDSDGDGRRQYRYNVYCPTEDEQNTDDESDTNTMRNGASDDEEDQVPDDMPETPRYEYAIYAHEGTPNSYATEDEDGEDINAMDGDGDTEMSASPGSSRASRSVSASTDRYGNETGEDQCTPRGHRGDSVSTDGHGYEAGELGVANHIHEEEDDSSDNSVRPPPRRLSRRHYPNPSVQQTDPRISMMFAEHQQSLRGAQNHQMGVDEFEGEVRRVEPASRYRRMTAYRLQPPRRVDPLRSSRSPSATRIISSSNRLARLPRQYQRR